MTPEEQLCSLVEQGNLEAVNAHLQAHPDLNINYQGFGGYTALHYAIYHDKLDIVYRLLEIPGIDVNVASPLAYRPLHTAMMMLQPNSILAMVQALLTKKDIQIEVEDINGNVPLSIAFNFEVFELLLNAAKDMLSLQRLQALRAIFDSSPDHVAALDKVLRKDNGCQLFLLMTMLADGYFQPKPIDLSTSPEIQNKQRKALQFSRYATKLPAELLGTISNYVFDLPKEGMPSVALVNKALKENPSKMFFN